MQTADSDHAEHSAVPTRFEKFKAALSTLAVALLVVLSVVVSPSNWLPRLLHPGAGTLGEAPTNPEPIDLGKVAADADSELKRQLAETQSTSERTIQQLQQSIDRLTTLAEHDAQTRSELIKAQRSYVDEEVKVANLRAQFAEQAFSALQNSIREEKEREARSKVWHLVGMGFVTLATSVLAWFTFRNPRAPKWAKEVIKIGAGAICSGWAGK